MLKASRKAKRISKKIKPTVYDAKQMLSYLGWVKCTNVYNMYLKWIKPFISFQELKRIVSKHDKMEARKLYDLEDYREFLNAA